MAISTLDIQLEHHMPRNQRAQLQTCLSASSIQADEEQMSARLLNHSTDPQHVLDRFLEEDHLQRRLATQRLLHLIVQEHRTALSPIVQLLVQPIVRFEEIAKQQRILRETGGVQRDFEVVARRSVQMFVEDLQVALSDQSIGEDAQALVREEYRQAFLIGCRHGRCLHDALRELGQVAQVEDVVHFRRRGKDVDRHTVVHDQAGGDEQVERRAHVDGKVETVEESAKSNAVDVEELSGSGIRQCEDGERVKQPFRWRTAA